MGLRSDNSYTILVSHRHGKRGGVMGLPGAYEETFSRRHYRFPTGRYEDRRIFLARIGEEIFLHRRLDRAAEILVFDAEGNEVDPEYFVKVYNEVSRKYRDWRNAISLENPRRYRTSRQKKKLSSRFTVFHADHGIKPAQMRHIQSRLEDMAPQGFFIKQVIIPKRLGPVPNALYGPASGDAPVSESEVRYMDRSGRGWEDRMVDLPVRPDDKVQAIGIRNGDEFTLFTVYGGPLAPQNPADPGNPDPEGAKRWWSQHALSTQQWAQTNPRRNPMKSDRDMARKILRAIHDTVVEAGAEGVPESTIFMAFGSVPRRDVQKFVNALVSGGRLQRRNNVLYASDASMAAAGRSFYIHSMEEQRRASRTRRNGDQAPFIGERYEYNGSTFKGFRTREEAKKFADTPTARSPRFVPGPVIDTPPFGFFGQIHTASEYADMAAEDPYGFFRPLAVGESFFLSDEQYNMVPNPRLDMNPRRNPMRRNAGRHFRRGKKVRDHGEFYMGAYEGDPTLFAMSKDELVEMGTAAAIKELRRRGRDADGVKLAWKR
jgi:hypothetical protein